MATEKRLIDAQPIVKFIMDGLNNPDTMKALGHDAIEILTEIEYAPTVEAVEVVHGRWISWKEVFPKSVFNNIGRKKKCFCSYCGALRDKDNYCPNCGAKMDGKDNVPRTEGDRNG